MRRSLKRKTSAPAIQAAVDTPSVTHPAIDTASEDCGVSAAPTSVPVPPTASSVQPPYQLAGWPRERRRREREQEHEAAHPPPP